MQKDLKECEKVSDRPAEEQGQSVGEWQCKQSAKECEVSVRKVRFVEGIWKVRGEQRHAVRGHLVMRAS